MRLSVERPDAETWSEAFDSSPLADPAGHLLQDNPCPPGSVLAVEARPGVPPPALLGGERVSLELQGIGKLTHPVRRAESQEPRSE
jgi:hypothetical protein